MANIFSVEQNDELERENGRVTLLDSWKFHGGRSPIDGDRNLPHIGLPGGASDHQVEHKSLFIFQLVSLCRDSSLLWVFPQWTSR